MDVRWKFVFDGEWGWEYIEIIWRRLKIFFIEKCCNF